MQLRLILTNGYFKHVTTGFDYLTIFFHNIYYLYKTCIEWWGYLTNIESQLSQYCFIPKLSINVKNMNFCCNWIFNNFKLFSLFFNTIYTHFYRLYICFKYYLECRFLLPPVIVIHDPMEVLVNTYLNSCSLTISKVICLDFKEANNSSFTITQ